jgi:hypothetical protein
MESKQPTSDERSDLETPKPEESEDGMTAKVEDAIVEGQKPVKPAALYVLTGDALRALMDEQSKSRFSWLQMLSNNALIVVFFSGLIGGALTYYYTQRQKNVDYARSVQQLELARQRSFSDEVNKLRIQKFGEVWQQLDEHEFAIDGLLDDLSFEEVSKDPNANNKRVDEITKLIHEDKAMTSRNRFWLGEELYNKTMEYLDMNVKYALNKRVFRRATDLSELIKKRQGAKQDILEIRRLFLEGEIGSKRLDT